MIENLKEKTQEKITTFEELEGNYFLLNKSRVFIANFQTQEFEELINEEIPKEIQEMRLQ